jgi:hypothetical protein
MLHVSDPAINSAFAQTTTGLPPFATINSGLYDAVKINDGAILLTLPVRSKAGLIPFDYSLTLNSTVGISDTYVLINTLQWSPRTSVNFGPGVSGGFRTRQELQCSKGKTFQYTNYQITDASGTVHPVTCPFSGYTLTYTYTDTTLQILVKETQTWTPFSGNTVLTKDVHSWTDAAGKTQAYTFNYSPYTHLTNFGCYLPSDQTAATWYLPSSITPEGSYYIYYEDISGGTTGRISQITFPSGASVQYGYSGGNNGLTCEAETPTGVYYNIMVPVLTRILIDTNGG